ncbi:DUF7002 family protein [Aquabacterium sp.]|uniref:DUF7002 family protein n=1 Tax=Aquabacterium sp. TaxID=1872578 RepID=UPI003D6D7A5A
MEVKDLTERYPQLYHMAEKDTWQSIKAHGLLSTAAVLDRYGVKGKQRLGIEEGHRPEKMLVGPPDTGIVLRDQKPMLPSRLADALIDGTTPAQWYKFLNGRVFMWAQETRLFGLLGARHYRDLEHDVLTIDSKALMSAYSEKVWLCRMNSGNTWPVPHLRGMNDFLRIKDYPTKKSSGAPLKEVVEVVVDYSIPDIAQYVTAVRRMKGKEVLGNLPL